MNAARGRGGEHPVAEDRQVEHRRAAAALDQHEDRQQDRADDEPADHERVVPAGRCRRARRPSTSPVSPTTNTSDAGEVEPAVAVRA